MPPITDLKIATNSLQRLIKEEASYHSEVEMQEKRIEQLKEQGVDGDSKKQGVKEDEDDSNFEFLMKQEKTALEETKAVFPRLKEAIVDGARNLEALLDSAASGKGRRDESDITAAKDVLGRAKGFMD